MKKMTGHNQMRNRNTYLWIREFQCALIVFIYSSIIHNSYIPNLFSNIVCTATWHSRDNVGNNRKNVLEIQENKNGIEFRTRIYGIQITHYNRNIKRNPYIDLWWMSVVLVGSLVWSSVWLGCYQSVNATERAFNCRYFNLNCIWENFTSNGID